MAKNDVVLLDSLVEKARPRLGENRDLSEVFELFCFEQLLKDYDLSYDELEAGWTDSTNDGGIDGFFTFVDDKLATDDALEDALQYASRRSPEVRVVVFTIRHSDSFKQDPLNSLTTSIAEIFDLRRAEAELTYPFSDPVLMQRNVFQRAFVTLADRRPTLTIQLYYCCRGDTDTIADNLTSRTQQLSDLIRSLFSDVDVSVELKGASELLDLARRQPIYSLRLKFIESYISREGKNYVVLVTLPDYFLFVSDEAQQLRRYLFESNVRDYLGKGQINQDIRRTLATNVTSTEEDFWWLNNGVTILATHATVIGKELTLENVQIVNGLQTTETIYRHFVNTPERHDDRSILLKIILTSDEQTRAKIIKATNYQNTVDLASLRGLDTVQQNIEHFLLDNGWFYDRRKNFYKNQGKPADRIVSMPYLAAAVRAVALGDPASSARQRSRSLRDERIYNQVFNSSWDLNIYLASLEITRHVQLYLEARRTVFETPPIALVHYVGFIYACSKLGKSDYEPSEVGQLASAPPTESQVLAIREDLRRAGGRLHTPGRQFQGVVLKRELVDSVMTDLGLVRELSGTIKRVILERECGFIDGADGKDYRFRTFDLGGSGLEFNPDLVGQEVKFEIQREAGKKIGLAKRIRRFVSPPSNAIPIVGTIKSVVVEKGYGFINATNGNEYHFRFYDLADSGLGFNESLIGTNVEFEVRREADEKAGSAKRIRRVEVSGGELPLGPEK
jgi:cold shock CspA family protein